jgi:hypothetical protein
MKYPTDIPFTQYLRPNGKAQQVYFQADQETYNLAQTLLDRGFAFEAEVLTTGEVSLTVSDGEEDIAIQVCPNGPGIENFVNALVREAIAVADAR